MDPIGFFHIAFQIPWQRQTQLVWAFLMPDPHLHICDRYIVLFKTGRIWLFDPSGLFQYIKRFPCFVQLLAGLLSRLWWKLSVPQISFMCFFLIIPVRILFQSQLFIMMAFIVADIPEFGSRITHMPYDIGIFLTDLYGCFMWQQHSSSSFNHCADRASHSILNQYDLLWCSI